jgi:N-acetylmuramoyl-L-alanine amidase
MRPALTIALCLTVLLAVAACTDSEGASDASTPSPTASATASPSPTASRTSTPAPTPTPSPTPPPTSSPTPILIHHPPPYTVVIDAGHGGLYYWGASARDSDGNQHIEKDFALEVALRLRDLLLADEGARYVPVLTRDGDYTLTYFDAGNYRPSVIAEQQARVDLANAAGADVILSVHFNGWHDASQTGTETYCNPDRVFGNESCQLAYFVQDALVAAIRESGYDIYNRGAKNDAEVGGDPEYAHSHLLGTNPDFRPSFMPGIISEVLFLSSPPDLEFLKRPDAFDIIARAYKQALDDYFAWLVPPGN